DDALQGRRRGCRRVFARGCLGHRNRRSERKENAMKPDVTRGRIAEAQNKLREHGFDGMLVIKPEHVRYLTGFWGYSTRTEYAMPRRLIALIVPASGESTLIVPKIELNYARRQTWITDLRHHVEWEQAGETFGGLVLLGNVLKEKSLQRGRLGVETGFISAKLLTMLQAELSGAQLLEIPPILEDMRMIKSPEEIAILRISGGMAVAEYRAEANAVRAGVREFEIAAIGR